MAQLPPEVQNLIDPDNKSEVIKEVSDKSGNVYYWISEYSEDGPGGDKIIEVDPSGKADLLAADSFLDRNSVSETIAKLLDLPEPSTEFELGPINETDLQTFSGLTTDQVRDKLFSAAIAATDTLVSRNVPLTNNGRRACAWAVNTITKKALGRPIGGGLQTAEMVKILRKYHRPLDESQLRAGSIVISPTVGKRTGHVGIMGREGYVHSNSSAEGIFRRKPTLEKWKSRYSGLPLEFFDLSPNLFPGASA